LLLFAECYANECLAQKLAQNLKDVEEITIRHKEVYGRDTIIKILKKILAGEFKSPLVEGALVIIVIIDYEKGDARKYIDNFFSQRQVITEGVVLGTIRRVRKKIVAVIFDPNIEEAFLCKISDKLCRTESVHKRIKSKNARSFLEEFLESNNAKRLIELISQKVLDVIGH